MVTFGQKVLVVSCAIIFLWLFLGTFMYRKYLQEIPVSKLPEQEVLLPEEVFSCTHEGPKQSPGFWKTVNLHKTSIPQSLKDDLYKIRVEPHSVKIQGSEVHYIVADTKEPNGLSVLLLHGSVFTSSTWKDIGTLRMLASLGYYTVAIDFPGCGKTESNPNLNKGTFLLELISALKLKKPVLISPSMSGSYSMKPLIEHPEKFGAFVAISPVGTNLLNRSSCRSLDGGNDVFLNEDCRKLVLSHVKLKEPPHLKLNCIPIPTLVVWGESDRRENSAKLCLLPESVGAEIPKGEHPAYLTNPDLWHELLYNFLSLLSETKGCRQNTVSSGV